jgi:hypothetical protein
MQPTVRKTATVVKVEYPGNDGTAWAYLEVETEHDPDCMINCRYWQWFGLHSSHKAAGNYQEALNEVWEWLVEWELIELRSIGPEDSEYFATDKLMEVINDHTST